ncbi:BrnT family toxin [bacterium]|nr:BrnT family toxin [bacterium]
MAFRVTGFEWDRHNTSELSNHNIQRDEAETVFAGSTYWWKGHIRGGEIRYRVTGKTFDGRFLTLVATIKTQETLRIITGWDAEGWEIKRWRSRQ